ncbi:unnamed protein product, partial [Staurois parvus]
MPAVSAHQCHIVPTNAHQCHISVPVSATYPCQSVPHISAANQCHLSVPYMSVAFQCPSVMPVNAHQ